MPATTVACATLLEDQVPPAVALLNVVVKLTHTENVPVIAAGVVLLTVTTLVVKHPPLNV